MKLFISWSGDKSKAVAICIKDWIKLVIQSCEPWISTQDIPRGAIWGSEIFEQLENSNLGVICVTIQNKNAPWLNFEAGAISKGLKKNLVCAFLVDLESSDIAGPLEHFNHTTASKEGVFELVKTISRSDAQSNITIDVLKESFEAFWPRLESQLEEINSFYLDSAEHVLTDREILIDVLNTAKRIEAGGVANGDSLVANADVVSSQVYDVVRSLLLDGVDVDYIFSAVSCFGVSRESLDGMVFGIQGDPHFFKFSYARKMERAGTPVTF